MKTMAARAAAGFTALTAVPAFFAVKDGVLTKLLQADPTAALYVSCLLDLGALCGLSAPVLVESAAVSDVDGYADRCRPVHPNEMMPIPPPVVRP